MENVCVGDIFQVAFIFYPMLVTYFEHYVRHGFI